LWKAKAFLYTFEVINPRACQKFAFSEVDFFILDKIQELIILLLIFKGGKS
jgi:hypothetical protein